MDRKRLRKRLVAPTLLLAASAAILSAPGASAALPQGVASTVTCYNGAAHCTQYHYSFVPPGTTGGAFHIYYTVQWSSSLASFKVIVVRWVNNSSKTIYFGGYGVHSLEHAYGALGQGSSASTYAIGAGSSYTFTEGQFNGGDKGFFYRRGQGAYGASQENVTSWRYHASGASSFLGAYQLG